MSYTGQNGLCAKNITKGQIWQLMFDRCVQSFGFFHSPQSHHRDRDKPESLPSSWYQLSPGVDHGSRWCPVLFSLRALPKFSNQDQSKKWWLHNTVDGLAAPRTVASITTLSPCPFPASVSLFWKWASAEWPSTTPTGKHKKRKQRRQNWEYSARAEIGINMSRWEKGQTVEENVSLKWGKIENLFSWKSAERKAESDKKDESPSPFSHQSD